MPKEIDETIEFNEKKPSILQEENSQYLNIKG